MPKFVWILVALAMTMVIAASAVLIWRHTVEVVPHAAPAPKPEPMSSPVPKGPVISYVPIGSPAQLVPPPVPSPVTAAPEPVPAHAPAKKRAKPKPKPKSTARAVLQKQWGAKPGVAPAPSPGFLEGIRWPTLGN